MAKPPHLVIVTGLSGSGVTTALNALADLGMYCIDNLPMYLAKRRDGPRRLWTACQCHRWLWP